MRRFLLSTPLALLASACTTRAWTPSAAVAYAPPSPQVRDYVLPAQADALQRWQLPPDDPWAPYAKYTLLTALDGVAVQVELPDVTGLDGVQQAMAAARQVAADGLPPDTLWIVDMRGAASVAFGVTLSQEAREPVRLVPTFNNWPATDELVPAEETLAALASMTPTVREDAWAGPARPVFLLDSWRLAYRYDDPGDDTYDNRYILTQNDLPDAATLRAYGIRRVVYVVENRDQSIVEEDDVHESFLAWEQAGIPIAMLDLQKLEAPLADDDWDEVWEDDGLYVVPRLTVIEDPAFYVRAHGGFGGIHARPSPVRVGGAWWWRGGYGKGHGRGRGRGGGG